MPLTLRDDVSTVPTDDGMVLLDERTGRYFQLNVTGATITQELLDGADPEDTAVRIAERYSVTPDRVAADITEIIRSLRDAGLVAP